MERREIETRLELVIGAIRDHAIFMIDPSGRIQTWNLGAQVIKGYQADEAIGKSIEMFYSPEDLADGRPHRLLSEARRAGHVEDEGWRVRKDGTRFWADVVITAIHDATGDLIGFAKITRDLTERRRAEQDRLQLAEAEAALKLRDEFMSIAAHELRTPLVALQLQIESVEDVGGKLDAKARAKLDRARRNVVRLGELVTTLLDASRIATGQLVLSPKQVDLAVLVADAIDRQTETAAAAKCEVRAELAPDVLGSYDPLRIGQVVTNLLANAFKYAAGAPVDVTLGRDGDHAVLAVADRGPGIPLEHRDRVFGRFARAVSARHYGGLGLGLYLARQIATAHGGTIHATDRDGGGAIVELRLPIRHDRSVGGA